MKIYICGKITGIEQYAERQFQQAEDELTDLGHQVANPFKLPHEHNQTWEAYLKECITEMLKCDAVYLLTSWRQSEGAKLEARLAGKIGMKIIEQT